MIKCNLHVTSNLFKLLIMLLKFSMQIERHIINLRLTALREFYMLHLRLVHTINVHQVIISESIDTPILGYWYNISPISVLDHISMLVKYRGNIGCISISSTNIKRMYRQHRSTYIVPISEKQYRDNIGFISEIYKRRQDVGPRFGQYLFWNVCY